MSFGTALSHRGGGNWIQAGRRLVVGILALLLMQHVCAAPSERVDRLSDVDELPDVVVIVVTREATHRYVLHNGSFTEMPDGFLPEKNSSPYTHPALRKSFEHQLLIQGEPKKNRNVLPKGAEWALFSTDKKRVVYGFDSPFGSKSLSLVVARTDEQRVIYSAVDPAVSINEIRWLPDAKSLVILESKSRLSMTPLGIFGALSGHGMPVIRYTLRIVSFDSDDTVSVKKFPCREVLTIQWHAST